MPDWWASISPGIRSVRSLGAITVTSGSRRASTLGRLIAATMIPSDSRSIQASEPSTSSASAASTKARNVGAESSGFSAIAAPTTPGSPPSSVRIASASAASTRLAITATVRAWLACSSATALSAALRICSGARPRPCTTSTTGDPRFAAILALNESSVPLATSA